MNISVCEIAAFVAVVDYEGFTAAGNHLHLSQPGVSARVQRLERALGSPLFDRSVRQTTLTRHGQAFLPHARALLASVCAAAHAAGDVTSSLTTVSVDADVAVAVNAGA